MKTIRLTVVIAAALVLSACSADQIAGPPTSARVQTNVQHTGSKVTVPKADDEETPPPAHGPDDHGSKRSRYAIGAN